MLDLEDLVMLNAGLRFLSLTNSYSLRLVCFVNQLSSIS